MADVRSLLRNELASRGSSVQSGSTGRVTKKRKIEGADSIHSIHKKSRPTTPAYTGALETEDGDQAQPTNLDHNAEDIAEEEDTSQGEEAGPILPEYDQVEQQDATGANEQIVPITPSKSQQKQTVDEDEWAAFEREVAAPTRVAPVPPAAAAATISAAPVTADELAVQQQKQKEEQARAREEDVEGEKEDAARLLEEEFEEMEQLEERVKRLKAKREELRVQNPTESDGAQIDAQETVQQGGEESEDDEEDDDDWDDWRFRK